MISQAQGFVYFADGFTVMPGAAITMDCVTSAAGAIDLRGTGAVFLEGDLALDSHVTISDGGYFSSAGKSLILGGDIAIPAGKVIHCAGDMVIDGGGRTVNLEPHAQLVVDANATVTLRNMIIAPERMGAETPALGCAASGKLCLDNVVLNLSNDLQIDQGTVFVHNDVVVSGTSALLYQSPKKFNIAPHGTLYMDHHTTFSFAPKSVVQERLNMHDISSKMVLDAAKFISTGDDLRLPRGTIIFDGVSHFEHYGAELETGENFDNPRNILTQNIPNIRVAAWSPDGSKLLVGYGVHGNDQVHSIQLYFFNGNELIAQGSPSPISYAANSFVTSIAWSPDGEYVAVGTAEYIYYGGDDGDEFDDGYIFIYDKNLTEKQNIYRNDKSTYKISWSPYGDYLSVVAFNASTNDGIYNSSVTIYEFNRDSNSINVISTPYSSNVVPNSMSWAPDKYNDLYFAVGFRARDLSSYWMESVDEIRVYKDSAKNGDMELFKTKQNVFECTQVAWSPNGNWIAAVHGYNVSVYQWTGSDFGDTEVTVESPGVMSVDWFANSKYLAVGYWNSIAIYAFDGVSLADTGILFGDMTDIKNVYWVPDDGAHLLGRYTDNLNIFNTEFAQEFVPATGKKVHLGPKSDLNVTMMPGTRVNLHGDVTKH